VRSAYEGNFGEEPETYRSKMSARPLFGREWLGIAEKYLICNKTREMSLTFRRFCCIVFLIMNKL